MQFSSTEITLKRGDITQEEVDVIVNAANSSLLGGVDGAIHRAGGPAILEECRAIGGCWTGHAIITTAGNLKARWVVHTVGPIWRDGGYEGIGHILRHCYWRSLKLAVENGARSIAFPSFSIGAYGYPIHEAAPIALTTVRDFISVERPKLDEVRFVLFSEHDLEVYRRGLVQVGGKSAIEPGEL